MWNDADLPSCHCCFCLILRSSADTVAHSQHDYYCCTRYLQLAYGHHADNYFAPVRLRHGHGYVCFDYSARSNHSAHYATAWTGSRAYCYDHSLCAGHWFDYSAYGTQSVCWFADLEGSHVQDGSANYSLRRGVSACPALNCFGSADLHAAPLAARILTYRSYNYN